MTLFRCPTCGLAGSSLALHLRLIHPVKSDDSSWVARAKARTLPTRVDGGVPVR